MIDPRDVKMSHIMVIRQIQESIGCEPYRFEALKSRNIYDLEVIRDRLIEDYNKTIKGE